MMWDRICNFFDSTLKRTLDFIKWDSENRENRRPSNKRRLEEESVNTRAFKIRRFDLPHPSRGIDLSYSSSSMEDNTSEVITIDDTEQQADVNLSHEIMSPEPLKEKRKETKFTIHMDGLTATEPMREKHKERKFTIPIDSLTAAEALKEKHPETQFTIPVDGLATAEKITPLGENRIHSRSTSGYPLRGFSGESLSSGIGMRVRLMEELRSPSSTRPRITSATRLRSLFERQQHEEKEKYLALLQNHTLFPIATRLNKKLSQQKTLDVSGFLKIKTPKKPEVIEEIDLTSDSPPPPEESPTVSPLAELKEKLAKSAAYDMDWMKEYPRKFSLNTSLLEREVKESKLRSAFKNSPDLLEAFNDALEERMQQCLRITGSVIEEGPLPIAAEEEPELPKLTEEMQKRINAAFQRVGSAGDVLCEAFSLRITRRDIQTLNATNWLNDEVINFYMNLLIERGKNDNYPSVYCFNTFFYPKLATNGHSSLKRWTRKIDIFAHEILIIPVHMGVHWCMACVKFGEKRIEYYDSMGAPNNACLRHILKYLQDESLDKKKEVFDITGWTTVNIDDNPQQMNGSDCGMFSCMYAEYICRRAKITFTQDDMPYFRRKMAYEILTKKLLM